MARRLTQGETTSAKVVKLRPRKAKGAGGQKRSSAPVNRLKPAVPIAPQPTDADVRRATQDRLIALHGRLKPIEGKIAAAQEAMAELKAQKQAVRGQIQQTCVPLAIYDEVRKRVDAKTQRADNELYEKQRALAFEAFGLPVGPQPELPLEGLPEAAKPSIYWREVGYRAAVDGLFSDAQRDGVPPESVQDYMAGFSDGTARNGAGLKVLEADGKAPPAQPTDPVEGEAAPQHVTAFVDFPEDPDAWTEGQRAQFREWFDALPDDADIVFHQPAAEVWFDRLNAEVERELEPA